MRENQIRLFAYILFTTSILMLVAPIIPHHHHSDASHTACMKDDWSGHSESLPSPFHSPDYPIQICSCTQTDQTTVPADQLTITPSLFLITVLFPNPLLEFISLEQKNQPDYLRYKERIITQYTPSATGLRAPPYLA